MGLAASQARFLGLTARKSNTEYQGQQINQQRTALANESAGLFAQMTSLTVPIPPDSTTYYNIRYNYTDFTGSKSIITYPVVTDTNDPNQGKYFVTYDDGTTAYADSVSVSSGLLQSITFGANTYSVSPNRVYDDAGYQAAMTQYDYAKAVYDKAIADINAKTEVIQQNDRTLELKLKQIDTDHNAIQTEMEAVKKVMEKNIEMTFKTFA